MPHEECFYGRVEKDQSNTLGRAVSSLLQVGRPGYVFIESPVGSVRMPKIDSIELVDVNVKKLTKAVDSEFLRRAE